MKLTFVGEVGAELYAIFFLSYLCNLLLVCSFVVVTIRRRCCRYSPMVRKTFGRDEVAEYDRCILEINIRFPNRIVKGIAFPFHEEFVIIGICQYIKLLLQRCFYVPLSLLSYQSTIQDAFYLILIVVDFFIVLIGFRVRRNRVWPHGG